MCYPSPESGEKKFSSPGADKANMITASWCGHLAAPRGFRQCAARGPNDAQGEGKRAWKGPLHYMLVLAPAKGESKVMLLTWHTCQQEGCKWDAGSVLVSPMHYSQLT